LVKKARYPIEICTGENERKVIITEVKEKITGMGSLTDIYLQPPKNANIIKEEANHRFGELVSELDKQITDLLKA
jgi:hypothetical protein